MGARSAAQLLDNLGALRVVLTPELLADLEAATQFQVGFPRDFIEETKGYVYGDARPLVDGR